MRLNGIFSIRFKLLSALLVIVCWVVSGCSGSDVPVTSDTQSSLNTTPLTAGNTDASENSGVVEDGAVEGGAIEDTVVGDDVSEVEEMEVENLPEQDSSPVVADVQNPNTVLVTFEITVPYYLSDELRVQLTWDYRAGEDEPEIAFEAEWVAGQFWLASSDFPRGERLLTITFYDKNGAVGLARHTQMFGVGSDVSEIVYISADQFDANQFDSDGDGVNNLTELNGDVDAIADDSSQLEIQDFYAFNEAGSQYSRISVSQVIDPIVKLDRPYVDAYETECCDHTETRLTFRTLYGKHNINIDADGNGTVEVNTDEPVRRGLPRLSATRVNSGNAIFWTGEYLTLSPEYAFKENLTNTVSVLDDSLRSFAQEVTGTNNGTYRFSWQASANLVGKLIDGSSLCEPVSGTFSEIRVDNYVDINLVVTTVSKEIDDPYWRVVTVHNGAEPTEYFARELQILFDPDDEDSAYFTCDFVDW